MDVFRQQFVERVLQIARTRFPLEKIDLAEHPFALSINGHVASLENLFRLTQLKPDELQRQAERWVVELLRAADSPDVTASFDEVRDRVLPMILQDNGSVVSGAFNRPLVTGLAVAYAVDHDRTIAYVSPTRFQKWGMDPDELHELALSNLSERSGEINAHAAQDESGHVNLMLFQTLDGYDASRILLPSLHDRLREYLGSPFAAAIPNRDILLCFRDETDMVEKMRPQVAADFQRMPHQITDRLLLVTLDGIAPHE